MHVAPAGPAHILVVDDEPAITDLLATALRYMGYRVSTRAIGARRARRRGIGRPRPRRARRDAPRHRRLRGLPAPPRRRATSCPVIFLSARDSEDDRVTGFVRGGDDYVTKPFSLEELTLRIGALLRRVRGGDGADARLRYRDLEMDEDRHQVWRGDARGRALAHRVPAAALLPAQPRARPVEAADPRPRLAVRLQRRGQRRRDVRQLPPPQARRRRAPAPPHRARLRLRAARRRARP